MANRARATEYAPLIVAAASRYRLAPALLAGLVDHESGWNPRALRVEVAIHDASRGLGQLLLKTARSLGYTGTEEGLFDPAVNLDLAAKYLDKQIRQAQSVQGGLSAYNGGWRPRDGFGAPSQREYTAVLARSQTTGEPTTTRLVRIGEYANQPYVDAVMRGARDFAQVSALNAQASASSPAPLAAVLAPSAKPAPAPVPASIVPASSSSSAVKWIAAAAAVGALAWLVKRMAS